MAHCSNCNKEIGMSAENACQQQIIYQDETQYLLNLAYFCKECLPPKIQLTLEEARKMQEDYRKSHPHFFRGFKEL